MGIEPMQKFQIVPGDLTQSSILSCVDVEAGFCGLLLYDVQWILGRIVELQGFITCLSMLF